MKYDGGKVEGGPEAPVSRYCDVGRRAPLIARANKGTGVLISVTAINLAGIAGLLDGSAMIQSQY